MNCLILILLQIQRFVLNVGTIKPAGGLYKPTLPMNQAHNFSVVQNAIIHGEPQDRPDIYSSIFCYHFFIIVIFIIKFVLDSLRIFFLYIFTVVLLTIYKNLSIINKFQL